jgi:hypothetical protein
MRQGRFLAPQAISAVDIAADDKVITVGTMAFSHDANVWQFSPDGTVIAKRHFPPWAPMQVATLRGGRAVAVGLVYSRVTSPDPTVWFGPTEALFAQTLNDRFAEADSQDGSAQRKLPSPVLIRAAVRRIRLDNNAGPIPSGLGRKSAFEQSGLRV